MEHRVSASLAEAFRRGNGRTTNWAGETVHSVIDIPVSDGDQIVIERLSSSSRRAQALKLGIDRGELRANGVVVSTIAIWSHTAPENVTVDIIGRRARSVALWNAWSYAGVDSSWLGNAGIIVETVDEHTRIIRCSDGLDDAAFDDLVLRLEVRRHA